MRYLPASIRLGQIWFGPHRLLLKLASLRRAGLAVRTGASRNRVKGRRVGGRPDSEHGIRRPTGRNHHPPGARDHSLKLENAGLRSSHSRQAWQDASATGSR